MTICRFDPQELRRVANLDPEKVAISFEIVRPIDPGNAIEGSIGLCAMSGFIPGLKGKARQPELWPGKILRCPQFVHAGPCQPDTGFVCIRGGIDDINLANTRAPQCESKGCPCLPAADNRDVVIDTIKIGYPLCRASPIKRSVSCATKSKLSGLAINATPV